MVIPMYNYCHNSSSKIDINMKQEPENKHNNWNMILKDSDSDVMTIIYKRHIWFCHFNVFGDI